MINHVKNIYAGLKKIIASHDLPTKPKVLNFMANDICNSRCLMCNVWKRKEVKNLSPEELRFILSDELFSDLEYVGISGGEPTLRKDLDEIFKVFTSTLKNLKGIGLITNGLNTDQVLKGIERVNKVCVQAGVPFNAMVSLDGIGEVHDRVRGKEGNFKNAVYVLRYLRDNTDIPISIGCTIIKENVWNADQVLQFCRDENIYGRFRIGEFIDRLYNQNLNEQIRNFDDDERYQIMLFFNKLYYDYETSPSIKATYRSIIAMIAENQSRLSGCPYRHSAIGLDSVGNLLYCSPKSPNLGICLNESPYKIYLNNLNLRQEIIKNHCKSCIHDYHDEPSAIIKEIENVRQEWTDKLSIKNSLALAATVERPKTIEEGHIFNKIFIVGWYGTETAGDKAILDEIIFRIKGHSKEAKITIASMYPFITRRTLKELGLTNVAVIDTYSPDYLETCRTSDAVIMGGGPLMGMDPLGFVLAAFAEAAGAGVPTFIDGCGIGPIAADLHISTLKEIIRLASVISVRDTGSLEWISSHTGRTDARCSADPAVGFIIRYAKNTMVPFEKQDTLACFLREITTEYIGDMTSDEFTAFKYKFEEELGKLIRHVSGATGLRPLLMPMHTFVIGNDDRDFARRLSREHLVGHDYVIGERIYAPQDILSTMLSAELCLCMRFHSVLFADVLDVPYIPVDYTGGGKIKGFLKDRGKLDSCLDRKDIAAGTWKPQVNDMLAVLQFAHLEKENYILR